LLDGWSASVPATFATCPGTQGSLVRFLVREGASGDEARQFLSEVTADGRHRFWPDDLAYDTVDLGAVVAIVSHRCQSRCAGPGPRRPAGDPG